MTSKADTSKRTPRPDTTTYLGGSDAAAAVGLHPKIDRLELYHVKRGEWLPRMDETFLMRLGLLLEPVIAQLYTEETGTKLRRVSFRRDKRLPFLGGHLDFEPVGLPGIVDCKLSIFRGWMFRGGADPRLPEYEACQGLHYLGIRRKDRRRVPEWIDFPVLTPNALKIVRVNRDEDAVRTLRDVETELWTDHILAGVPPAPDFDHPAVLDSIRRMYPAIEERVVELGEDHPLLLSARAERRLHARAREYEQKAAELHELRRRLLAELEHETIQAEADILKFDGQEGGWRRLQTKRGNIDFRWVKHPRA